MQIEREVEIEEDEIVEVEVEVEEIPVWVVDLCLEILNCHNNTAKTEPHLKLLNPYIPIKIRANNRNPTTLTNFHDPEFNVKSVESQITLPLSVDNVSITHMFLMTCHILLLPWISMSQKKNK